ncbi:bile acid:sodium symporter family protein [Labrys sp. 22185]|uniref:bile acid:sodium symporter family protein n=1 Tax=Labrys sp. 22185 TaxID=3453888 RepID=UPI003F856CD6
MLMLLGVVALASFLPIAGRPAEIFAALANGAIALLFFLHGARLSRDTVIAGLSHWRLHLTILLATYALFPVLALALDYGLVSALTPTLASGILFLAILPSTVQSSIAFTSIAGGNVPAAVCAASGSNILGIFITPLLAGLLFASRGVGFSGSVLITIVTQLLLPFVLGQVLQPWIGGFVRRHRFVLGFVDRGSILMVVYLAFSEAVTGGLWRQFSATALLTMVFVDAALLALVLLITTYGSRRLGFSKEDEITIVFCGSKKSLATGVPMATVIFAGQNIGAIVLPLMLFHQIQLMTCAILAQRYARRLKALAASKEEDPTEDWPEIEPGAQEASSRAK